MHWDVSAGYTSDVCDCFYWHVDQRLRSNDRKRGILFVLPTSKKNATLDAFARLFHFNKEGNGMEFHSCLKGGDTCRMFSCYAQLLWHMELSNMVGCEEAGQTCVTRGYAWNAMPGYLIDEDVLGVTLDKKDSMT